MVGSFLCEKKRSDKKKNVTQNVITMIERLNSIVHTINLAIMSKKMAFRENEAVDMLADLLGDRYRSLHLKSRVS